MGWECQMDCYIKHCLHGKNVGVPSPCSDLQAASVLRGGSPQMHTLKSHTRCLPHLRGTHYCCLHATMG